MSLPPLSIIPPHDKWDELLSAPASSGSSSRSTSSPPASTSSGEFNTFSFVGSAVSAGGGWGVKNPCFYFLLLRCCVWAPLAGRRFASSHVSIVVHVVFPHMQLEREKWKRLISTFMRTSLRFTTLLNTLPVFLRMSKLPSSYHKHLPLLNETLYLRMWKTEFYRIGFQFQKRWELSHSMHPQG
jgi:hypothetical protein